VTVRNEEEENVNGSCEEKRREKSIEKRLSSTVSLA